MKKMKYSRRHFIRTASAGSIAAAAPVVLTGGMNMTGQPRKLAVLGGDPVRKNKSWPQWPYWDEKIIESLVRTTKSRIWCRIQSPRGTVPTFEKIYADLMGTKFCVATGAGTQALHTCVEALGIGPGDEVITSPYTDPGTLASILSARALPVLADLDPESYQLDPADVERRITENTRALMPVHIMGQPCDMKSMMAIAGKHKLKVIEDACQAHLAEFEGRKLGTIGDFGCFSFQSSKTLACGEGGAIIGNNDDLMDKCYTVHNHGTSRRGRTAVPGPKYRMNEFEAAVLLGQMDGLKERFLLRNQNANYLRSRLKDFPGLVPQKLYTGTDSGSFYIFAMSYHKQYFNDADRSIFLKALQAEGIDLYGTYIPIGLHREPWTDNILNSRVYQKMYSPSRLKKFRDELDCPNCDRVTQELVMIWATGPLLGTKQDMDDIADSVLKVYENRNELKSLKV